MATRVHGRLRYLSLDNPAGSLVDIRNLTDQADYEKTTDRPETGNFGQDAMRYQVDGLRSVTINAAGYFSSATLKVHGRNTGVLWGAYNLASDFDSGSITKAVDLPDTQGFGQSWKRHESPGNRDDSFSFEGWHNATASANYDRLRAAMEAASGEAVSVAYNGFAIGSLVDFGAIALETHSIPGNPKDVTRISASGKYDNGCFLGVSLHALTAETATADAASVDETAATANGGIGVIHITSVSGSGSITVKVQHSADNSSWSDLVSFTAATAIGSEIVTVATGATVSRYLRASVTAFSGFTSVTFQVSFARRDYASAGSAGSLRHWNSLVQRSATSTFNLGPSGNASGAEKLSGECRLSNLVTQFDENNVQKFTATLMSDDTVTEGTF